MFFRQGVGLSPYSKQQVEERIRVLSRLTLAQTGNTPENSNNKPVLPVHLFILAHFCFTLLFPLATIYLSAKAIASSEHSHSQNVFHSLFLVNCPNPSMRLHTFKIR